MAWPGSRLFRKSRSSLALLRLPALATIWAISPDIAARLAARLDDAGAHSRMVGKRVLDLLELDTVAPDLDLMVGAAEAFDRAVGAAAGEVAGPVQPRAFLARERIGQEALPVLRGIVDVAAAYTGAADAKLAGHADRQRLQVCIEHIELRVGQRRADRDVARRRSPAPWSGDAARRRRNIPTRHRR